MSPVVNKIPMSESLESWAVARAGLSAGAPCTFSPVSGDASFRQYFRLRDAAGASFIAVSAPPDKEDNEAFISVRDLLAAGGTAVPELHAYDPVAGYMLLSDFGDTLLLGELNAANVDDWYGSACGTLLNLQKIDAAVLPEYDAAQLGSEMRLFDEWFVAGLLGYELTGDQMQMLAVLRDELIAAAVSQPQVLVHRDYHSRNLMVLEGDELGVIDFQDARRGPVTYDLVSLLRDCYVQWPAEQVRGWALEYRNMAQAASIITDIDDAEFMRWFDLMGLQRHLKVLGIFARLSLRDGKDAYLKDLPLVVDYTYSVAEHYPEAERLVKLFNDTLLPLIKRQSWWSEPS